MVLDQLSVLLLVVVPGAHLVEQLRSTSLPSARLPTTRSSGAACCSTSPRPVRDVNRLGSEVFESITGAVLELGFEHTDVVAKVADGNWTVLADAGTLRLLPTPGEAASALRPADLRPGRCSSGAEDPDLDDAAALGTIGAALLVRINLSTRDDHDRRCVRRPRTGPASAPVASRPFACSQDRRPWPSRTSTW